MKNFLILPMLALFASAAVNAQSLSPVQSNPSEKKATRKEAPAGVFKKAAPELNFNKTINPYLTSRSKKVTAKAAELPSGTVLFEDFEDAVFEEGAFYTEYLPEGWSFNHVKSQADHLGWLVYAPYDASLFSSNAYVFNAFEEPVDEWLISPEVEIGEGMILSADIFNASIWYFDFTTVGFYYMKGDIRNDFVIHISEDGGQTWNELYSMAKSMDNLQSYSEIFARFGFEKVAVDLNEYAGKKVKVGFQVVGNPESNAAGIDNIKIGLKELELSYDKPWGSLYFGITDTDIFVPASIMTVPVFHPVTFENSSYNKDASYYWTYETADGETVTDSNEDALNITYTTNHTDESTSRNNLHKMPVLYGEAPNASLTSFTYSNFLQAGGRGEYEIHYTDVDQKEVLQLGLTVADPYTEGTQTYADIALPYFGYNVESDYYWSRYCFQGQQDENNWAKHIKIANLFFANDAPIVIEGVRANGYGQVTRNTKFTAEIYLLDEDFIIPDTPAYTAVCTGNDINIIDRNATNYILTLDFKFDEPVVISSEVAPYYVVAIGGFNDPDNVEYFSPEMSAYDNPSGLGLGWVAKEICFEGEKGISWAPVYNHTSEYLREGEQLISFFIMLDAAYPWLEGEDVVTVDAGTPAVLELDSYYPADELAIEGLPEWLKATASGRYGNAKVTFTSTGTENDCAEVTLSAPGVSKKVKVGGTAAGIGSVESDGFDEKSTMFTIDGRRVDGTPAAGVYIVRRADGSAFKKVIR